MIQRLRERASYLPARTQGLIAWSAAILAFILASVIEGSLHGVAAVAFWSLSTFFVGMAVAFMVSGRRR